MVFQIYYKWKDSIVGLNMVLATFSVTAFLTKIANIMQVSLKMGQYGRHCTPYELAHVIFKKE